MILFLFINSVWWKKEWISKCRNASKYFLTPGVMTGLLSVAQHGQVICRTYQSQLLVIADPASSSKIDLQWKTAVKFVEIRRRNLMYLIKITIVHSVYATCRKEIVCGQRSESSFYKRTVAIDRPVKVIQFSEKKTFWMSHTNFEI